MYFLISICLHCFRPTFQPFDALQVALLERQLTDAEGSWKHEINKLKKSNTILMRELQEVSTLAMGSSA